VELVEVFTRVVVVLLCEFVCNCEDVVAIDLGIIFRRSVVGCSFPFVLSTDKSVAILCKCAIVLSNTVTTALLNRSCVKQASHDWLKIRQSCVYTRPARSRAPTVPIPRWMAIGHRLSWLKRDAGLLWKSTRWDEKRKHWQGRQRFKKRAGVIRK
jgi:hypothetical protein